jgi:hypothetical protein
MRMMALGAGGSNRIAVVLHRGIVRSLGHHSTGKSSGLLIAINIDDAVMYSVARPFESVPGSREL